ncbi:MAG: serine/threonine-protein phosphatase [Gammaproteobacteria bacterium]|nr:serine/threonine-protein phosphatase [Gammaproteobacteria bacterium]
MNTDNSHVFESFGLTDVGLMRDHNEDTFVCLDEYNTWIICDGMGGHQFGELASQIAIDHISSAIKSGKTLTDSIQLAHKAIIETVSKLPEKEGMGTTAIVLQIIADQYEFAWVGDSRGYLFDGQSLRQLTRDHSLVQSLIDSGNISQEQAWSHPKKNIITQSLGYKKNNELKIDSVKANFLPGQTLILCSDGLTTDLSDKGIEQQLLLNSPVKELANNLIDAAKAAGGRDNISVVVVRNSNSKYKIFTSGARAITGITIALILYLYIVIW